MLKRRVGYALLFLVAARDVHAQQAGAATQRGQPTYQVTMVPGTITAINYQNHKSTEIAFQGSPLLPLAKGHATVTSQPGRIQVDAQFRNLAPARRFGAEYITYVLWAITPEGKTNNLGEVLLDGTNSELNVTTSLQTFGLIVTAEPYYAVSEPSDAVVLENVTLPNTAGTIQQVNASYQLLGRGQYSYNVAMANQSYPKSKVPIEVEEARNAVQIARAAGADQYAAGAFGKALASLAQADSILGRKGDRKLIVQSARDAVQNAADARRIAIKGGQDAAALAQARADSAAAAARQQQAESARQEAERQALQAAQQAQQAAQQAQQAGQQAQVEAQARAQADSARQAAQLRAQQQEAAAAQATQEKEQLRATLLQQFNRILPTTDTPHGLKVNLGDVLFDVGKFELRPPAREALAKFSGIVIAHPGLKLQVEGYTDNVGGDVYNQTLSENRANSVRAYLITQGVDPPAVTAVGYGKANPIAGNETPQGRQQNRRVEIIISGEIIGTQIGRPS